MRVTALAGGTGAAKLLRGLASARPQHELTIIGNTGDDTEIWGLHVSPDLDTVMYALAGRLDAMRGWGVADDTFRCLEAMGDLGAAASRPAPGVLEAIREADLVVVCPSNPVTSVGPVLAVPGMAQALAAVRSRVVAVSPIVGGAAVSGPAGELMRARGLPVSPVGVAAAYAPWLGTLVIDRSDAARVPELERLGVRPVLADILMTDRDREIALAQLMLAA